MWYEVKRARDTALIQDVHWRKLSKVYNLDRSYADGNVDSIVC